MGLSGAHMCIRCSRQIGGSKRSVHRWLRRADLCRKNILRYWAKPSCELSPLIVYADFEVFTGDCADGVKALGCQNRVAAVGYAAVGMLGYSPPEKHQLRLIHAQRGEHECAVVLKFISAMVELAEHFKDWRLHHRKPRDQHREAQRCRECCKRFGIPGVDKVAHHDHGTGAFLGSLCQNCNKAAHQPTQIPICFHNGGHYDFHFVLRAIAKLKHYTPRIVKDGDVVRSKRRRSRWFGIKELADRVKRVELKRLLSSMPDDVICKLQYSKMTILQKSGETNLTMSLGNLRFLDTMNFCGAG